MKPIYVYPGSFCPPTWGHFQIMKKAASLFDELTIVCSENPNKINKWFSPDQCADMWMRAYPLPSNVRITTIEHIRRQQIDRSRLVIVRGVRNETHFDEEKGVMFLNLKELGIDKFFYLVSDEDYRHISSSVARSCADDCAIERIGTLVAPLITTALLEHALHLQHLIMVVGKPGSGKSTFLQAVHRHDPRNIHINTDQITDELKPLLQSEFRTQDLLTIALEDEERLKSVIAKPWLEILRQRIRALPKNSNGFIEIPYGLQEDKAMQRFVGGKVLFVTCGDDQVNIERLLHRKTETMIPFVEKIPGPETCKRIAKEQCLELITLDLSGAISTLDQTAIRFTESLMEGKLWKTYSRASCSDTLSATTCSKAR